MIEKISVRCICLLFSIGLHAQHTFSVEEAQQFGLQNNYEVKNALLEVGIASKQMKETIATGLPQINAEGQWQKFLTVPTTLVPSESFGGDPSNEFIELQFGLPLTTSASITASQLLFNGSYLVGLKAAKSFMAFSRMRKDFTENQIEDSIAVAYYNVLITKENRDFLEALVEAHNTIVTEIKAKYEAGFVEDLEVDRMELALSNMRMQFANMSQRAELSEAYLKLILGVKLEENIQLTDSLPQLLNSSISFKIEEANVKKRIEYKMAVMNAELKKLDLRRYQTDKLPTITAFGSVNTSSMGNEFTAFDSGSNWYPSQLVGVKVSIPIFDGLGGSARIQKARLVWEQAKNTKNQTEESLQLAHLSAQSEFINSVSNYEHQETNLVLSKKIYEKTLAKYREGLISSLELSHVGTEYLNANTNFSKNIYTLLIKNLNYQRSLGK